MKPFDLWLRRQVLRLEHEISSSGMFERSSTPTRDELMELRRLAVIHRFLNNNLQQLDSVYGKTATLDKTPTREI